MFAIGVLYYWDTLFPSGFIPFSRIPINRRQNFMYKKFILGFEKQKKIIMKKDTVAYMDVLLIQIDNGLLMIATVFRNTFVLLLLNI